jgi:putative ABC transport system ATP-binding protein
LRLSLKNFYTRTGVTVWERRMLTPTVVQVEDLYKDYVLRGGAVHALRGINLSVRRGEYIAVMGPSGSGKTTLFNMIGGLDKPTKGTVKIDNVDLSKMSSKQLAWVRSRKIGYVFQTFNLIPVLTALGNVMLPMIFTGMKREERVKKAKELLSLVGLGERVNHRPTELSGGQQQRVAIARALANDPSIILADEPTGNLDLNTGLAIVNLLYRLKVERNTTVICATHDLKMVDVSDRLAWIRDGQIERIEERTTVSLTSEEL